ncbi:MAG TPA: stage II sporulation protein D [Clostridiaceae bacterium]|jgi:stage II sporulation protein D|nr:stage II sporulation protein D [Clostridiaceae bacterium]
MKRIVYYIIIMIAIIIILPMFIVKSCSFTSTREKSDKRENQSTNEKQGVNQREWEDEGNNIKICVYIEPEGNIKEIVLEEYVIGVVAAEMPAEFAFEALKAQAVAARTYAYGRLKGIYKDKDDLHANADICTDFSHCQAWISKEEAIERWDSSSADEYWDKIKKAVEETEGIVILYKGVIANPVFHSNSGGKTENAEEVWDVDPVDYLKSVISKGEEASPSFKTISKISVTEFYNTLKEYYPDIKVNKNSIFEDMKIVERTQGDRVKTIKVGNIEIKGTDFRKIFSLSSANFQLDKNKDGMIEIITFGNGHGVGMSQWGANNLAKSGEMWEEIIKYYYLGVELDTISNVENILAGS